MKRTSLAVAVLVLTAGSATLVSAAPPSPTSVTVNPPAVTCSGNNLVATASVTTDAELEELHVAVERWETIKTSYWPDQRATVERWQVNLSSGGRKAASLPKDHTIDTPDSSTWMWHDSADPTKYIDNSGVFIIYVDVSTKSYGRSDGAPIRTSWLVDCELGNTATPYDPWEALDWQHEQGTM